MSIFRRKPKFKVGDRVMVNSLFLGAPSDLDWPLAQDVRAEYVGRSGYVERVGGIGAPVLVFLDTPNRHARFYEWELRPA